MRKTFLKAAVIISLGGAAVAQTPEQCANMAGIGGMFAQLRLGGMPLWQLIDEIDRSDMSDGEKLAMTQLASMTYMSGMSPTAVAQMLYDVCMETAS